MPPSIQVSTNDPIYPPGFAPYANTSNVAGTSTMCPLSTPMMSNPLFMRMTPTNIIPQPTMILRPKFVMIMERKEMAEKMKSLEQSIRDMQGLGSHKGISFSDLCMFPHVYLPVGFKTPKFKKYDGHGDPIAHLKRYCNQLMGAEGKKEFLMAYFGESLVGIASERFIDQDITNWHTWDDLARCFVQQFQYNIDIVTDRSSLANTRKKTTENFLEYAVIWREQAARVKPPMKESKMIDVFLQA
ncbi:hypothetical protein KY289_016920 [Solanum tuberosum]|nr:hypothetical protein KY289_016920 [Solanum tuberosum]